jgi:hypothetical protein
LKDKLKERGRAIPPVDVEIFEQAFAAFREALCSDPSEDREIGGIGAVYAVTGQGGDFMNVCGRCLKLLDLIRASENVRIHKQFPSSWLATAATAPVRLLGEFDAAQFPWEESVNAD